MQHILALSVILLHHVDSYSCRSVAKQLQPPPDPDTGVTESIEVEEREREISSILKQFLARSSDLNSSEQLQNTLAKLTIEPYQVRNITKRKDLLHRDKQDTIAPLAIIVTSLQELNRLKNRNKNNEKINEEETVTNDPVQDALTHPKEMSSTNLNTDVRSNKESSSNEYIDADDVSIERHKDIDVGHKEDFFLESDVTNLSKDVYKQDNPYIDVAWLGEEELLSGASDEDATNEKTKSESLPRSNDKNTQLDINTYTEPSDVEVEEYDENTFKEDQQVDAVLNTNQENLINLLKDGADLKLPQENINLKLNDAIGESKLLGSALEPSPEETNREKCKKKHNHNPRNTYHLSFLFNR